MRQLQSTRRRRYCALRCRFSHNSRLAFLFFGPVHGWTICLLDRQCNSARFLLLGSIGIPLLFIAVLDNILLLRLLTNCFRLFNVLVSSNWILSSHRTLYFHPVLDRRLPTSAPWTLSWVAVARLPVSSTWRWWPSSPVVSLFCLNSSMSVPWRVTSSSLGSATLNPPAGSGCSVPSWQIGPDSSFAAPRRFLLRTSSYYRRRSSQTPWGCWSARVRDHAELFRSTRLRYLHRRVE